MSHRFDEHRAIAEAIWSQYCASKSQEDYQRWQKAVSDCKIFLKEGDEDFSEDDEERVLWLCEQTSRVLKKVASGTESLEHKVEALTSHVRSVCEDLGACLAATSDESMKEILPPHDPN